MPAAHGRTHRPGKSWGEFPESQWGTGGATRCPGGDGVWTWGSLSYWWHCQCPHKRPLQWWEEQNKQTATPVFSLLGQDGVEEFDKTPPPATFTRTSQLAYFVDLGEIWSWKTVAESCQINLIRTHMLDTFKEHKFWVHHCQAQFKNFMRDWV